MYSKESLMNLVREKSLKFGDFILASGKKAKYYLDGKQVELEESNRKLGELTAVAANRRRLTNLGTFRAYALAYLQQHQPHWIWPAASTITSATPAAHPRTTPCSRCSSPSSWPRVSSAKTANS